MSMCTFLHTVYEGEVLYSCELVYIFTYSLWRRGTRLLACAHLYIHVQYMEERYTFMGLCTFVHKVCGGELHSGELVYV